LLFKASSYVDLRLLKHQVKWEAEIPYRFLIKERNLYVRYRVKYGSSYLEQLFQLSVIITSRLRLYSLACLTHQSFTMNPFLPQQV